MTEKDIQNEIILYLQTKNYLVYHFSSTQGKTPDGRYAKSGVPVGWSDIFAISPTGEIIFIEVKKPDKFMSGRSKEQVKFMDIMSKRGIRCGFACSLEQAKLIIGG